MYLLSHLQFSVSEQAVLLDISPASVTKARQSLKAKCYDFTATEKALR
ncbi:MAG: hypothetical protein IJQ93_05700 [Bacteroidales bacterium]|nr:hypothetical protein [Bacteroidales bacterium]